MGEGYISNRCTGIFPVDIPVHWLHVCDFRIVHSVSNGDLNNVKICCICIVHIRGGGASVGFFYFCFWAQKYTVIKRFIWKICLGGTTRGWARFVLGKLSRYFWASVKNCRFKL